MKKVAIITTDKNLQQNVSLCIPRGIDVLYLSSIDGIQDEVKQHSLSLVIIDTDYFYDELLIQWKICLSLSLPIIALSSVDKCSKLFSIPGSIIHDVIQKPICKTAVQKTIAKHMINIMPKKQESKEQDKLKHMLIGNNPTIKKIRKLIPLIADTDEPILIYGESGTGKEIAAQCLAACSKGERSRLIPQHLGAIPENLIETTLFGSICGAFTGARNLDGLFATCGNGTVFLDEIGEINQACQVKLLRVLETGEYSKVGSCSVQKSNARIICATNRNLDQAVKEGTFRLDLFYRINVLKIELPPLRERPDDIVTLTSYFLDQAGKTITYNALNYLTAQEWPGNVRELYNVLKRATILCKENQIDINDLAI